MASPAADDAQKQQEEKEKILFRFCSECSNLLFPREDKETHRLLFACRTCAFTEEAQSACVMRHEISSTVGATAGITQDVGQDPTVGLTRHLSNTTLSNTDPELPFEEQLPSLCTMCGQEIICIECGEESAPGIALETFDADPSGAETDSPASKG
ncbi:hypothetical protein M011DRAFT_473801 [Sporormia fimetaria CBS 119925]|uniref:DNA-directed RNA polymerase II subunit RPB9-like zinc ribbon domain-containing protein n=1 Tax=Sporormia fimetaria CBS 119925 TaxID=1340428 RepID=A0A6A6VNJ4_9PLEO|nr:hypothetical protein M011DRAFT_473801 [Sporormia fimetaria CBS 119925]